MALKLTIVCVAAVLMAIRGRADEIGLAANTTSYQDNEGSIGDGDVSVDFEQGRSNQAQAESASTGTCNSREEHSEIAKLAEELAETKKQLADIVAAQTQQQAASSSHAVHAQAELSTLTDQLQKADAAQTQLGEDRASDLCAANERVLKRDVELPEGLWGVNLTVGVVDIRPFAMVDSKAPYGVGDGLRFGGPVVLVFDTMAKQHGVQVTYVAMPPIDRDSTTITEYLLEHAPQYDLLMGPFIRDSQRTRRGLMFTEGIVDYTLGLYMKRKFMSSDFKDSLWLLVRPFDASGWFVVLGVIGLLAQPFVFPKPNRVFKLPDSLSVVLGGHRLGPFDLLDAPTFHCEGCADWLLDFGIAFVFYQWSARRPESKWWHQAIRSQGSRSRLGVVPVRVGS